MFELPKKICSVNSHHTIHIVILLSHVHAFKNVFAERTTEGKTKPIDDWLEGKQLMNIIILIGNFVMFTAIGLSITYYSRKYRLKRKQTRKRANTEL